MARATNLGEFEAVLRRLQLPIFTVIYADRDGHVLSLFNGQVPVRPDGVADWSQPVPGDASATLWTAIHAYEDLPRVVDPLGGWVQNSNSPPWYTTYPLALDPDAYPAYMAPRGLSWREMRGIRMLEEHPAMSLEQMVELKHSTRFELADRVLDSLIVAARDSGDETAKEAADVMAAWDREANPDSTGVLLFAFWAFGFGLEGPVESSPRFATPADPAAPLTTPAGLADPAAAVGVLIDAANEVEAIFGRLAVPWGEVARLQGGAVNSRRMASTGTPSVSSGCLRSTSTGSSPANGRPSSAGIRTWRPSSSPTRCGRGCSWPTATPANRARRTSAISWRWRRRASCGRSGRRARRSRPTWRRVRWSSRRVRPHRFPRPPEGTNASPGEGSGMQRPSNRTATPVALPKVRVVARPD